MRVAVVVPAILVPFFSQAYVSGPVPEATVAKVALVPRLFVRLTSGVATVLALTFNTAALEVTLPHAPLTTTL